MFFRLHVQAVCAMIMTYLLDVVARLTHGIDKNGQLLVRLAVFRWFEIRFFILTIDGVDKEQLKAV
jgi:hypothetical protein